MKNEELIKQIAKNSRKIVEEAGANNVTTEDEVEHIVVNLLTNDLEEIKKEAISKADERLFLEYHSRGYSLHRDDVKKRFDADLALINDTGADYGALSCCVMDGFGEDTWTDVRAAVRQGIIDSWGPEILDDAETRSNCKHF